MTQVPTRITAGALADPGDRSGDNINGLWSWAK